jgi:hypothetical protein
MLLASLYPTIMAVIPRTRSDAGLRTAQRYFQILGVDVIIDAKHHPVLLELNDRPSLSVTVPFEEELKSNMIRDAFCHVTTSGATVGESDGSQWQQLIPVSDGHKLAAPISTVMKFQSTLKYTGRSAEQSPGTNRMLTNGINQDLHEQSRLRAMQLREVGKMPRFKHYLKTTQV